MSTLLHYYCVLKTMRERWETARVLAHQGDGRALGLFMDSLTNEFAGCNIDDPREGALLLTLPSLIGVLAHRCEMALTTLIDGVDSDFWRARVSWRFVGESPVDRLVDACIKALATCNKEEAWKTVLNLKQTAPRSYLARHANAFVDAAFFRALFREGGWAFGMTNSTFDSVVAWSKTPEGVAWREWASSFEAE